MSNCFNPANILLPNDGIDMEKWSVIACDQFTSQADYYSSNSFVVLIFSTPVILMHPLMISSPAFALRGRLSPVSALVLRLLFPSTITPSIGTFSPGCTTITEPTSTSSGSTFF